MPAGRFIADDLALAAGATLDLPPELAHQARDVLRLGPGDTLRLLDGAGGEYSATLLAADRKRVSVRLGAREAHSATEPAVRVVLCQGMLKAAKYEVIVQKGTELGIAAFVPLLTERSVAAAAEASDAKRLRWRKIAAEAVEQCGGTRLPALDAPQTLPDALAALPPGAIALIPWEGERSAALRPALAGAVARAGGRAHLAGVWLFIGPEGGFSAAEIALAQHHGALPVTLGPRILRAETAAIVVAALTLDALAAGA
ncbi:MAG: 16S rRNA (uracil(1498)-N(3))-methyltransferase [Ktedonobacterales bacterium]